MRINVTAHDLVEREVLVDAALAAHISLLTYEERAERRADPTYLALARMRDALLVRLSELRGAQEARRTAEDRHLDGHPSLFPDAMRAWEEQLRGTELLADPATRLAELDGVPPADPADPDAASLRVTELVAALVEPAKSTALEKLGEGERAMAIATAWLRPKMGRPERSVEQPG